MGIMQLENLDKINEAWAIINGLRDNTMILGSSQSHQFPDSICSVYTAALDMALSLLSEVKAGMKTETEETRLE